MKKWENTNFETDAIKVNTKILFSTSDGSSSAELTWHWLLIHKRKTVALKGLFFGQSMTGLIISTPGKDHPIIQ
jgi:hypothetical protein